VYFGRITMGRVTYPKGSLAIDVTQEYRMRRWADPTKDDLRGIFEVGYGLTDGVTLELIGKTRRVARDAYALDRVGAGATVRVAEYPLQVAPFVRLMPSVRGGDPEAEAGVQVSRNEGNFTLFMYHKAELAKATAASAYALKEYEVEPGVFYRFGLHGLAGLEWEYKTDGQHMLDIVLGGSLGRSIFLGVEEKIGLNDRAPALMSRLQLSFYFGRYALGSWGF